MAGLLISIGLVVATSVIWKGSADSERAAEQLTRFGRNAEPDRGFQPPRYVSM
jgi:hypothetical protein